MINSVRLERFQDTVLCRSSLMYSKESFLPVDYTFTRGNVYGLISDFGCGSWGVATAICGRFSSQYTGTLWIDDSLASADDLASHACVIAEQPFPSGGTEQSLGTPRSCIEQALAQSNVCYSAKDIKQIFCLSDDRYDRDMMLLSGEIWTVSMAINFAAGKDIFCYPWLNMIDIARFEMASSKKIISFLKDEGKIIIVPSSQKKVLNKSCDYSIDFTKRGIFYRKNSLWSPVKQPRRKGEPMLKRGE